jgi:hypothetical protein
MSVPALRVSDRNDPHWEGTIHLTRPAAEAHVAEIRKFFNPKVVRPVIEPAEVDHVLDQRVTVHGWHVGYKFNRRSMGRRTVRQARVQSLRMLGDCVVGVFYYSSQVPRAPVVLLHDDVWSSYSLGDSGEIITAEG